MSKAIDWEAIERDWSLGKWTSRELGQKYGVSHTAINKRAAGSADKNGVPTKRVWKKQLAEEVTRRAQDILAADGIDGKDTREIIERAAQHQADIIRRQRVECEQFRTDLNLLGESLRKRYNQTTVFPHSDKSLAAMTRDSESYLRQRDRLQEMERRAYAMDPGNKPEPVNDDELIDLIAGLVEGSDHAGSGEADSRAESES
jgi:hypothetical protein